TLRTVPAQPEPVASTLLAKQPGFSLHAATCWEANKRDKLEKLCRYIARPAIAKPSLSAVLRRPHHSGGYSSYAQLPADTGRVGRSRGAIIPAAPGRGDVLHNQSEI
ncbi:MAG: transposase, partial [Rhodospirillaceae bacterium]|nr:transposase [Rhodospirillaceae bacterium]